uniref:Uncharacterized protein n=1 Tax=Tanacetum cinerariifolium TaxID=118510 RepID=A0A6L2NZD9_TANCI|nr:hypothetical protein [Tanacetum cinerariifolium]
MLVERRLIEEGDADENVDEVNAGDTAEGDVSVAHGEIPTVAEEPSIPSPTPPTPPPQLSQDIPSTYNQHHLNHLRRVKKLERRNKVKVLKLRRLQKVGTTQRVETSNETVMGDVSNQGRMTAEVDADVVLEDDKEVADEAKEIAKDAKEDETKPAEVQEVVDVVTTAKLITKVVTAASETITAAEAQVHAVTLTVVPARDTGKGILVEEPKPLKKKQEIKQDEQYARDLQAELNKNIDWDEAIDHVKRKAKEDPAVKRYQRLNETSAEKGAKRQKLDEDVEELKRHLLIVPNKDDDVYTEATPLARKVPVVDYQIIEMNNKPYYKIIRADNTHQLYVSFLTLLRNFDREDFEALWSLVKERFSTTKPKNFSDDFLLVTLGAMFEKPDIHAQILKNQRSVYGPAKVKGWKLLESCGVQIIMFTTIQLILLVEKKYPLIRFTLDQMLNAVRLEVKEESEVSLKLLRFTRQQHQKGQLE